MRARLPDGWTIERVRAVSGDRAAVLLPAEQVGAVRLVAPDPEHGVVLRPDLVIGFGGSYLLRVRRDWFLAFRDGDGTIFGYANQGSDLEEALRSL
ncbi:hypothetical protein ACSNOI_15525 [Actinomadura kijaniata]|uniref:hypothetical protein n=1 Tax=Actinomadura kijaniata TaxID=46161 RepID=UPI003F198337